VPHERSAVWRYFLEHDVAAGIAALDTPDVIEVRPSIRVCARAPAIALPTLARLGAGHVVISVWELAGFASFAVSLLKAATT
jgi:hypothetical protein